MEKKHDQDLHIWGLEVAAALYMGNLQQWQIDKLKQEKFPWGYYFNELDKLGFDWVSNHPSYRNEMKSNGN